MPDNVRRGRPQGKCHRERTAPPTFLPRKRKARSGRSPVNGKEIKIHSKTLPAFAAGQGFKEAVDKK